MDINKKIREFNKRWNIEDDFSYEEEFKKFKVRVINIFSDIDPHTTEGGVKQFCNILGIREVWLGGMFGGIPHSNNIINALKNENDEKKFYYLLQIISCLEIQTIVRSAHEIVYSKNKLFKKLAEAIELSKVNLAMTITDKDEIIFRPCGEDILDEELVNEVLSFLNIEAQRHFIEALKNYEKRTDKDAIKSAESLRRSLEEFLRFKFGNDHGLQVNITKLGKILKSDGKDVQIRNIITQTFTYLDQFFNENSKHKDGDIQKPENEYLLYQTGLLMRYIDRVVDTTDISK